MIKQLTGKIDKFHEDLAILLSRRENSRQLMARLAGLQDSIPNKQCLCEIFGDTDDNFWYWLFIDGYEINETLKQILPSMPDERIQTNFTGRSGHHALREAFAFYKLAKDILARNSMDLKDCTSVLDFGCGWGRIIRFFLKDIEASGLWGIDCYKEMIDLCRAQNLRCNLEPVEPLPPTRFKDGSFDLIYLYSVFSHLSEDAHLAWLKEFMRILRPGGMMIATTRPRSFIVQCRVLSKRTNLEDWQRGAALSFANPEKALEDYDDGKFVHSPTGGGGVLSTSFYGETCISKKYAESNWSKLFSKVGFIPEKEHQRFEQDVIFAKK